MFAWSFGRLLSSWVSKLETRTTTNADSFTSLQGQKEGIGKKKSVMPFASGFGMQLWIYKFVQGDFFFPARPELPESNHLFLDLSSEQKLSRNREPELSFTPKSALKQEEFLMLTWEHPGDNTVEGQSATII